MATITNDKTAETITTTMSNSEAAAKFAELFADKDSWVWFHIHKAVANAPTREAQFAFTFLNDLFVVAVGYGLKRPMIRVHYKDQRFKFYLSTKGTLCVKSGKLITHETSPGCDPVYTHDPVGDEEYVGCLLDGKFLGATRRDPNAQQEEQPAQAYNYRGRYRSRYNANNYGARNRQNETPRPMTATETEFFARLNADPIGFLAACSKDMNRCCYCNLPLEDARSKAVGYGKICAGRWGLPWGTQTDVEKAPSFAREYDRDVQGICCAVRGEPENELNWNILGDWQESKGLPRCTKPAKGAQMPRGGKKPVATPATPPVETPRIVPETLPPALTHSVTSSAPASYSSSLFAYNATSKLLQIDGSDLGVAAGVPTLVVRSEKTGSLQTFKLIRTEKTKDEVVAWHYAPATECGVTALVVHND